MERSGAKSWSVLCQIDVHGAMKYSHDGHDAIILILSLVTGSSIDEQVALLQLERSVHSMSGNVHYCMSRSNEGQVGTIEELMHCAPFLATFVHSCSIHIANIQVERFLHQV